MSCSQFLENQLHKMFSDLRECIICPGTNRKEETVGLTARWPFFYYSFLFIEGWGTASVHHMWWTFNYKTHFMKMPKVRFWVPLAAWAAPLFWFVYLPKGHIAWVGRLYWETVYLYSAYSAVAGGVPHRSEPSTETVWSPWPDRPAVSTLVATFPTEKSDYLVFALHWLSVH